MSEFIEIIGGKPLFGTVVAGGAKNAGLLAISILGSNDKKILARMIQFKKQLVTESRQRGRKLQNGLRT
jgi:phosphoribosylcarboxyaminoimidazole (NCAIR) mutase